MKFRATVVLEFQAGSIAEAGARLNDVLAQADEVGDMQARAVDLRTPPGEAPPVTLPLPPSGHVPGPAADGGG